MVMSVTTRVPEIMGDPNVSKSLGSWGTTVMAGHGVGGGRGGFVSTAASATCFSMAAGTVVSKRL